MIIRFPDSSGKPDLIVEIHEQIRSGEFIDFGDGPVWHVSRITNHLKAATHECLKIAHVVRAS